MQARPWTRLGVLAMAGHLGYELAAGVAVPLASRAGVQAATAGYIAASLCAYRTASRLESPHGDRLFAVVNALFTSAVITHYTTWPRTRRWGLPWLTECEGLDEQIIGPYNLLLQTSAVAAVGGLVENRRAWPAALTTLSLALPLLRVATPREYHRLLVQANLTPRWWNRRLTARVTANV